MSVEYTPTYPLELHKAFVNLQAAVTAARYAATIERNVHTPKFILEWGICSNVCNLVKYADIFKDLEALFKSWPKFSGDTNHPIPADAVCHAYTTHRRDHNQWGIKPEQRDEYTELRMELLEFLVNETKPTRTTRVTGRW